MSYYVVGDGQIIEVTDGHDYTRRDLMELAHECGCSTVYVIEGEPTGVRYEREEKPHKDRIVFGQPLPEWAQ